MKYCVDVRRSYALCIEVEADSEEEAEDKAFELAKADKLDLADFELTDEIETNCCGFVNENGEREYS